MTLLDSLTKSGNETSPYLLTNHVGEGGGYTLVSGTNQAQIPSNANLIGTDSGNFSVYKSAYSAANDQRPSVTFTSPAASSTLASTGILGRITGTYYYAIRVLYFQGAFKTQFYKFNASNFVTLGNQPQFNTVSNIAFSSQYKLSLDCTGTTISAILQRVSDGKYLDNNGNFSSSTEICFVQATDSELTSGAVGMGFNDGNTSPFVYQQFNYFAGSIPSAGAALQIGIVSTNSININNCSLTAITAAGGTAPYTYQWYRDIVSAFTPSSGNLLNGQNALTINDTTAVQDVLNFYKLKVTDNAGNSIFSPQVINIRPSSLLKIGFIGDSITQIYQCVTKTQLRLKELLKIRDILVYNAGIAGSASYDWVSGATNLVNTKNNFVTTFGSPSVSNPVWISIMLGVNDARLSPPGSTPAAYKANMLSLINDLIIAGYKIILNNPPCVPIPQTPSGPGNNGYDTEAGMANLLQYPAQLDSLVNGVNVFRGDKNATFYFATHTNEFITTDIVNGLPTLVHPNELGQDSYAAFWSYAIARIVFDSIGAVLPFSSKLIR